MSGTFTIQGMESQSERVGNVVAAIQELDRVQQEGGMEIVASLLNAVIGVKYIIKD